jgi:hypothetical protein
MLLLGVSGFSPRRRGRRQGGRENARRSFLRCI